MSLGGRFLYYYILDPDYSGHVQSLLVGIGMIVLAFLVGLMALLGDLIAANRRLVEETLMRIRRVDATLSRGAAPQGTIEGVERTGAPAWRHEEKS
jgi:hypothetical protein